MEPMAYIGAGMCALSMMAAAWGVSQVWTTIISTVGRNPQVKKDVDISSRPLLKEGSDKLDKLYNQRYQLYLDACDYHLINDSSLENIVNNIISIINDN